MNKYNPNPIVFKINNKIIELLELKIDYRKKPFIIEIISTDDDSIVYSKSIVKSNNIISLNVSPGKYKVNYYDLNNSFLFFDILDINETDNLYKKALNVVLKEIDNVGKESNKTYHLNMIRSCNYDDKARAYIENRISNILKAYFSLNQEILVKISKRIFGDIYGLGILQELDDDKSIAEIMVNVLKGNKLSTKIYYIKDSKKYEYNKEFKSIEEVLTVFGRVISGTNKELNSGEFSSIEVSRPNKDRVSITIPNFSENYSLNIRRFENFIPNKESMIKSGTINEYIDEYIDVFIEGEFNIGIGGKMGTGKSTMINYMLSKTDPMERKVVISSVNETDIKRTLLNHDVLIYNVDEQNGFTFTEAFTKSLRSTSNRIVVPEARSKEFREVYKACIQTSGNLFTAHATNPDDFLNACVDMYNYDGTYKDVKSLRSKIAKGIDIIFIMQVTDNRIRIKSICEVIICDENYIELNELVKWVFDKNNPTNGKYIRTGNKISDLGKQRLNENGVPMYKLINL